MKCENLRSHFCANPHVANVLSMWKTFSQLVLIWEILGKIHLTSDAQTDVSDREFRSLLTSTARLSELEWMDNGTETTRGILKEKHIITQIIKSYCWYIQVWGQKMLFTLVVKYFLISAFLKVSDKSTFLGESITLRKCWETSLLWELKNTVTFSLSQSAKCSHHTSHPGTWCSHIFLTLAGKCVSLVIQRGKK